MKFHFERIGPIDVADLELGDLTIIAGRNNTGKTYLVYTMYGFLRKWVSERHQSPASNLVRALVGLLRSEVGTRIEVPRAEVDLLRQQTESSAASKFAGTIPQIFSSSPASFAETRLSVEVGDLPPDGEHLTLAQRGEYRVAAHYGNDAIKLELQTVQTEQLRSSANRLAMNLAFPDFPEPFVLSAERFGIALFYKELDFTKSRLVELLQQIDARTITVGRDPLLVVSRIASRYAMPIKDNVDFTRSIENVLDQRSEFFEFKLHEGVKSLMNGYYTSTDGVIRFKSRARKRGAFDIPLHRASSSARGLSDLYFYLRHVACRNDILFIDEPETHLDTANQVMLARLISRLVAAGLKVLVSTHSDYLIKELNNLVMLDHLRRNGRKRRRAGYGVDEGMSAERIRAYVAEQNTLKPCVVDQFGIDAPVFDKTIDRINEVSAELAAAVEDSAAGLNP